MFYFICFKYYSENGLSILKKWKINIILILIRVFYEKIVDLKLLKIYCKLF